MSRLKGMLARLGAVLRPSTADARMEEEFAFHVEMEEQRLRAEGFPPDEARRRALARFGGVQQHREEMREGRGARLMHELGADLRYGARSLWKSRGLAFVAIFSLAIGIGANSAIFSIVNALLLRPRALARPHELVQLYAGHRDAPFQSMSYPSYVDFRDRNEVFSGLAAYALGWQFRLGGADDVEQIWGEPVSSNYFDVLGVRAWLGRTFLSEEGAVPGRNPVVVIGFGLWQRRFASDSGIIGRSIRINRQPLTVIGVAPPSYNGMVNGWAAELWVPTMMAPLLEPEHGERLLTSRGNKWVHLVGRLKPGTTFRQARSQFAALTRSMQADHPDEWLDERPDGVREEYVSLVPEHRARLHPGMQVVAWAIAAVVFVVVNLVLAIACMNLAGLLFARGMARRSEIAVRLALGAARGRIIRQLLTESMLLTLIATVVGVLLAFWSLDALLASMPALPQGIRLAAEVRLDWRVLLYTTAFATATGILFGLAPARLSSRTDVSSVLKDEVGALSAARRTSRARRTLVVAQVAFSLLLLIGAGLVLRSVDNVRPTRLGYASDRFVMGPVRLDEHRYDRAGTQRFHEQVIARVAALPGVQGVSLVDGMPGGFMGRSRRSTEIEGYAPSPGESLEIDASIVSPGYFTTMGIPIVQGRDFDAADRDGAPCVAIINEAFSRRYFSGIASPLGRHLTKYMGIDEKQLCRIVGVVRDDAWHSLQREVPPWYAMALLQSHEPGMLLIAHTAGDPSRSVPDIRAVLRTLEPEMPLADIRTLTETFGAVSYPFRLLGFVVAGCGLMALLLATVGIHGTVTYSVAQRHREMGIRMALGADRPVILRMVVGEGMVLVLYGLALGLLLGFLLTRVLTSLPLDTTLLFGVSATDLAIFGGVTMLLGVVALTACYIPALKATKVDPVRTLRSS
jgi:predicted permease